MASTKRPRRQPLKASNLVLVQDHKRDKNHSRKLDLQWMEPRLLVKTTSKGITGYIKKLYGNSTLKKYHLDNLLAWVKHNSITIPAEQKGTNLAPKKQDKNAMTYKGFLDQRAFFLNHY